jgi:hypothetical protein
MVRIYPDDYPHRGSLTSATFETWVIGKLREAGIPIKGILTCQGVERGTLMRIDEPEHVGSILYLWKP